MAPLRPALLAVLLCASLAHGQEREGLPGWVPVDAFNPDVGAKDGTESRPVRGGRLTVRSPGDPPSLDPMRDNDLQTQAVHQYLRDPLAVRDRLTYEWLPMLARWWETQDTVELLDGTTLTGRLIAEEGGQVRFAPGAARLTLPEHELLQFVLDAPGAGEAAEVPCGGPELARALGRAGRLVPRPGSGLPERRGVLGRPPYGRYTLWLDTAPEEVRDIPADQVRVVLDGPEGAREAIPALRREVVFVFHLRPGVRWQDGQPFGADDVVFSLDTVMNPACDAASSRQSFQDLAGYEKQDELTVRVEFGRQYFRAFGAVASAYIYPRHRYEPWKFQGDPDGFGNHFKQHAEARKPTGNGPYRLARWEAGQLLELERNPSWWASGPEDGQGRHQQVVPWIDPEQPYLDKLRWVVINETQAALKALIKGEVDADFDVEPATWDDPQTTSDEFARGYVRARFFDASYTFIGWNQRRKDVGPERQFFADARVRRAMTLLIPRERILREIHRGLGELASGPFPPGSPFADPEVEPLPSSLQRAQLLLDEAGWIDHDGDGVRDRDGIAFEFEYVIHNMRDYHQKVADLIKEAVERVGVRMRIKKLDWAVFLDTVQDQRFDAVRLSWGEPSPVDTDPFQTWHSSQSSGRGDNYVSFMNAEADRLILAGRREVDLARRERLYRRLHRLLAREQPYTFLLNMYALGFYSRRFRNVRFYTLGDTSYVWTEWYVPLELQRGR